MNVAPFFIFLVGVALSMSARGSLRKLIMLATPIIGLFSLITLDQSLSWTLQWSNLELELILFRVDRLSFIFGVLFHIAAILAIIYSWHVDNPTQQMMALFYPGSALGVVFAGDWLTFFVFWECLAITSVFFIAAGRAPAAVRAAVRYLVFQATSGVLLLSGVVIMLHATGDISVGALSLERPGAKWLLLAFAIKAAFPFLHSWLTDAYPQASAAGAVFLSAFTTKVAVYALARSFTGLDILIYIGAVMACFPIFFAVIENDLRRVLGYSAINQLGFMVCGIGVGTELAVNGAVAHAFNDVIFKGLLMMSMGAVLFRSGEMRASQLGGLFRSMPKTAGLCMIGAASISALPLFSGFVSKSMVMSALLIERHEGAWLALLFASAAALHYVGIKIPWFAFFGRDCGKRPQEAPTHMLIAMSIAASLCIFIGCYPWLLYDYLPFPATYAPFDMAKVLAQAQLLCFSALAFIWLRFKGLYPPHVKSTNLDSDWFYRKLWPALYGYVVVLAGRLNQGLMAMLTTMVVALTPIARKQSYDLLMPWSVQRKIWIVSALLATVLLLFYGFQPD